MAVAFADSSVVCLALPDLYRSFAASLVGLSWVITSYNLAVCVAAFVLVPFTRRLHARRVMQVGLALFTASSIGCAAAWSLPVLIVFRSVQGIGGALLLAAALPMLGGLIGDAAQGGRLWTSTGTFGAAFGPALGGALTQLADWRAIFIVQAPIAGAALLATFDRRVHELEREPMSRVFRGTTTANIGLACIFGALVGALFLSVLLVITVWELEPIVGALVVSALPVAALLVRPLVRQLDRQRAIAGGALLLAGGLVALALLPSISNTFVALALAFCGFGLGLAVPVLTEAAMHPELAKMRSATLTIGARHLGLVAALALIAPVLTVRIDDAGHQATLAGTRVIMDGNISLTKKVPIALDMRDQFDRSKRGEIPDLAKPFNDRGAKTDSSLRDLRDELIDTLRGVITRAFRSAFGLSALFALLTLIPAYLLGRRFAP